MVQLFALVLLLVLVAFPIWALIRIVSLSGANDALARRLREIERKLDDLNGDRSAPPVPPAPPAVPSAAAPPPTRIVPPPVTPPPTAAVIPFASARIEPPVMVPVSMVNAAASAPPPPTPILPTPPLPILPVAPPVLPPTPAATRPGTFAEKIDWEQFTGAKLLAWIGGLLAFLGLAFFVKYSFEHGWVSPELRATVGFIFALGLVAGGLKINRERYATTAQTLIATGIVSLYAVTFACNSIYRFPLFEQHALVPFALMALITVAAFLLAVRLEARVIAVLGIVGGFLTPRLLASGHDNPVGLFTYIALLDVGLLAVALRRGWNFLAPLGAAGTVLLQIGWAASFFDDDPDAKSVVATVVSLGFSVLFAAAVGVARRSGRSSPALLWSAAALPLVAHGFALWFVGYPELAARMWPLFGFVLAANACLLVLARLEAEPRCVALAALGTAVVEGAWMLQALNSSNVVGFVVAALAFVAVFVAFHLAAERAARAGAGSRLAAAGLALLTLAFGFVFLDNAAIALRPGLVFTHVLLADAALLVLSWYDARVPRLHLLGGIIAFILLGAWTVERLIGALLPWALTFYLAYAVLHTAFPLALERRRPAAGRSWWSQLFPSLGMVLILIPLLQLDAAPLGLWPCVLVIDVLAIGVAAMTASVIAVASVLVLTLIAAALWMLRLPMTATAGTSVVLLVGVVAVLFFAAGVWLAPRFAPPTPTGARAAGRAQIPAVSALLPFLLLIMMTQRLPLADPSPVFALAWLLVALVFGMVRWLYEPAEDTTSRAGADRRVPGIEWLPACALAGAAALEYAWHGRRFGTGHATIALLWYLAFYAAFAAFPFVFRRRFTSATGPWAVAALAGVVQFPLVYRVIQSTWHPGYPGIVPALFAVVPLLSLQAVRRLAAPGHASRLNQLAWFGGVALLFLTLVFPIQFERQWLTLGWALEGAALLWLFRRVPHAGLRATGTVLLVAAFARLAVNPAVLEYHPRSATGIFNWYLYSYGIVTGCLFAGAALLAPPRQRVLGANGPVVLNTLGIVLAFLLLNLEIADFFSPPGAAVLTFQFSGNFARDMSYTIGWALFALVLLLISLGRGLRAGRYGALALLGVALAKLFLHDLARLEALYRIGVLFAVAVIAIVASFAYQRFLPARVEGESRQP